MGKVNELAKKLALNMKRIVLDANSFTKTANTPNVETCILEYRVPQNKVLYLPANEIFDLRLVTKETFSLDSGSNRTSYTATLSYDIVDQPSYPMDGGDAVAYWRGTRTTISAINYTTNTVTAAVDDNAGDLEIYHIFGDGYLRIYQEPPTGYAVTKRLILNEAMRILNSRDHLDENRVPRYPKSTYLPEKYLLRVYLCSPCVVDWSSKAINSVIKFYAIMYDKSVLKESDWAKLVQL